MLETWIDIPRKIARRRFERRLEAFLPELYRLARCLMDTRHRYWPRPMTGRFGRCSLTASN